MTTMLPMAGAGSTIHFNRAAYPPKGPDDYVMAGYRAVTPGYLSTLGVPLQRGRLADGIRSARRAKSGRRQRVDGASVLSGPRRARTADSARHRAVDPDFPTMEIVGIVGDMKQSFEAGSNAEMFVPYAQYPDPILAGMYLNTALVRAHGRQPARRCRDRSAPRFSKSMPVSRSSTSGRWRRRWPAPWRSRGSR